MRTYHGIVDFRQPVISAGATYPTDGLIARYLFEDNFNDNYGSNNNWTPFHAPSSWIYSTGKIGKAYDTNTTNYDDWSKPMQNNTDASINNLPGTNNFSVSAWCKITNTNQELCFYVGWYNEGNQRFYPIAFGGASDKPSGSSNGCFAINRGGGWLTNGYYNTDMRDNNWHHYAITYSSGAIKGYIDNILRVDSSYTLLSSSYALIGGIRAGSWCANGKIDLLYYYGKTLSTDEISQLYNGGAGV